MSDLTVKNTIDWCVAFNGANVDVLSRVFFGSLFDHCSRSLTNRIKFHLIDNGASRSTVNLEYGPFDPTWYELDSEWKNTKPPEQYCAESVLNPWEMAGYMIEKCGHNKWCIISHFDMVFTGDLLAWLTMHMRDEVGIVGTHCPIMAINRDAYKQKTVDFTPDSTHDVGILLEIDLKTKGWVHKEFDSRARERFLHFGGGASHHNKQEFDHMRRRAVELSRENKWGMERPPSANSGNVSLGGTTVIHLTHRGGLGESWQIACMPHVTNFATSAHQPNYLRSDDTRAVTCPHCKKTPVFQEVRSREH